MSTRVGNNIVDRHDSTKGYVVEANNLAQEIAAKLNVPYFSPESLTSPLASKEGLTTRGRAPLPRRRKT